MRLFSLRAPVLLRSDFLYPFFPKKKERIDLLKTNSNDDDRWTTDASSSFSSARARCCCCCCCCRCCCFYRESATLSARSFVAKRKEQSHRLGRRRERHKKSLSFFFFDFFSSRTRRTDRGNFLNEQRARERESERGSAKNSCVRCIDTNIYFTRARCVLIHTCYKSFVFASYFNKI